MSEADVVYPRPNDREQFWKSWENKMYEFVGMDANRDPLMKPIDPADAWKCISGRALHRTWYPRWRSLCCDRWLQYEPDPNETCHHGGPSLT